MADIEGSEIALGVAAAVILLKVDPFTPTDGITRSRSEDRLPLILTKRAGRWLISHGHNTVTDPSARRFDCEDRLAAYSHEVCIDTMAPGR